MHCHILPGIDDGAENWEESINMAQNLYMLGFTALVATPHFLEGYFTPDPKEIIEKASQLQNKLNTAGIYIKVYPGCEAQISPELPQLTEAGKVLTVNNGGKYLLVEMPFQEIPLYTDEVLFRLKLAGVTPIIAHPERNHGFQKDINKLVSAVEKGYSIQVNAASLVGYYGSTVQKIARILVNIKAIHFLGTDLHKESERDKHLEKVLAFLKTTMTPAELQQITETNQLQVIKGDSLVIEKPLPKAGNRGFWEKLLGQLLKNK